MEVQDLTINKGVIHRAKALNQTCRIVAGCLLLWICFSYNWFEHTHWWSWASPTQEQSGYVTAVIQTCFWFVPLGFFLQMKHQLQQKRRFIHYSQPSASCHHLSDSYCWTGGTLLLLAELFGRALLVSVRRNGWVSQMEQVWQVYGAGRGWLRYLTPWVDGFTNAWALLSHQTLCKQTVKHSCGINWQELSKTILTTSTPWDSKWVYKIPEELGIPKGILRGRTQNDSH